MKRYLPFIIIGVVLAATIVGATMWYRTHLKPAVVLTGDAGADPPHARGEITAPVLLEEFGDFQCPPCATVAPIIDGLEKQYGSKLRVIFREHPLPVHAHSRIAARAAEAAGLQGHFWEMHHLLYQTQKIWADAPDPQNIFDGHATKLGLDVARFEADMKGQQVSARIAADERRGASLKVDSTPAIFVNNQRVRAGKNAPQAFRDAIDAALAKK